ASRLSQLPLLKTTICAPTRLASSWSTVSVGMRFELFMSRALQRLRVSIATRRYLLGDVVLRVIRLYAGMVLDALEMRDELGRDTIGQIGWNVVELAGPEVGIQTKTLRSATLSRPPAKY